MSYDIYMQYTIHIKSEFTGSLIYNHLSNLKHLVITLR